MRLDTMLMTPEEMAPAVECANKLLAELDRILLGHHEIHKLVLMGILSRGHILLEGLPGVGKTALVKALGQLLDLEFKRVQFTPDLLPSDILGGSILQMGEDGQRHLAFQPGPIFANIVLADEINRASPKTQAAMLEAMQERSVTLLGVTRPLPAPFFVLASQNPIELEGTYPIPEAQLDRFMFKLEVSGVDADVLSQIITERRRGEPPVPSWSLKNEELEGLFATMEKINLSQAVAAYIANLVALSQPNAVNGVAEVTRYLAYGPSPRAAIAMAEAARAAALLAGRPTVGFEDVKAIAPWVLNHRLLLNYQARLEKITSLELVKRLLEKVEPATLSLPKGFSEN
ncbi:MAG: AAA family ATPase [Victivallales bacterium]|nr:AAA family ATPase [Victivallales bacterium]